VNIRRPLNTGVPGFGGNQDWGRLGRRVKAEPLKAQDFGEIRVRKGEGRGEEKETLEKPGETKTDSPSEPTLSYL